VSDPLPDEPPRLPEPDPDELAASFRRRLPDPEPDTTTETQAPRNPAVVQDATENETERPNLTLGQTIKRVCVAFSDIRDEKKRRYAAAMGVLGTSVRACEAIGIDQSTPYTKQWREDAALQEALATTAQEMYGAVLEAEIDRRAVAGVWKPAGWHKGEPGGFVKEYSDLLLIFRAKGLMRERYGDQVRLTGTFANLDVNQLSDDQVRRLAAGENAASVLGSVPIPRRLPAPEPLPNVVAGEGDGGA
jgi:hypothetical protein